MIPKLPLLFFGSVLFYNVSAQTGPAGVGTAANNVLWLKADQNVFLDAGVTPCIDGNSVRQWNDASGNGDNATEPVAGQRAIYRASVFNGNPALDFDGVDDRLLSTTVGTGNAAAIFVVAQFASLAGQPNRGLLQGSPAGQAFTTTATDKSIGVWVNSTNNNVWGRGVQTNNTQCNLSQTTALAASTPYIIATRYSGAGVINQFVNNAAAGNSGYNNTLKSWSDFGIGRQGAESWNGDIAEVIAFNTTINEAQRIIVDNYLSSKYNITLGSNDYYAGDTPGNADYDRGVAGVGQTGGANHILFSPSVSAGLGFSATSGLANGDFWMAGYKLPSNGQDISDVTGITGPFPARWQRDWYIDITNGGAAITGDLTFDLSDGGSGTIAGGASNYVLVYRSGTSGNWTEITNATVVVGDQIIFSGVALTNDGYYTLATHDYTTAGLPIELLSFTGTAKNKQVFLNWETATETNNKEFSLYKSMDGATYTKFATVPSKAPNGNSLMKLNYESLDNQASYGVQYYRLRQTDYNGNYKEFPAISVSLVRSKDILFGVYPNPGNGEFTVKFDGIENDREIEVNLYDLSGKLIYKEKVLPSSLSGNSFGIVRGYKLSVGVYLLDLIVDGIKYPTKVVVQ